MLYPLSYRGVFQNGFGMLTPLPELVNRAFRE